MSTVHFINHTANYVMVDIVMAGFRNMNMDIARTWLDAPLFVIYHYINILHDQYVSIAPPPPFFNCF